MQGQDFDTADHSPLTDATWVELGESIRTLAAEWMDDLLAGGPLTRRLGPRPPVAMQPVSRSETRRVKGGADPDEMRLWLGGPASREGSVRR